MQLKPRMASFLVHNSNRLLYMRQKVK